MQKLWTWKRWLAVIGLISAAAFLLSIWLARGAPPGQMLMGLFASFLYTICIGSLCSLTLRLLTPVAARWPEPLKFGGWILCMVPSVVIGTLAAYTILYRIGLRRSGGYWSGFLASLEFAALITVTFGAMMLIYEYWRVKYLLAEIARERAVQLAAEARLASLESRIHPHFLFNTLNSISALIHSEPDRADEQLQRLCALLRFSLDAPETKLVPLEREMKIVRDYLEIERTRFGERLRYEISPLPEGVRVPPLSIQTLVENSVKHVIAKRREGGRVAVEITVDRGRVLVEIDDGGPGLTEAQLLPGHGLEILRSRLRALFAGDASLRFAPGAVRMELPL